MGDGVLETVSVTVAFGKHPLLYVITVLPEDATAPTAPVLLFTVATEGVPLVQVPPVTVLTKVPLPPGQSDVDPVIAAG